MGKRPTILHTEASNGWGGQEIRILTEMLGMKGRGYEVLLAAPEDASIYKKAVGSGIETFAVNMDRQGFVKGVARLVGIIKEKRVSLINTHSSRDSWMGSIAGRLAGIKVLRTRHISSELIKSPFTRLVYGPLCSGIVTTGNFIKGQLVEELGIRPEKILSIPTGVDAERFAAANGEGFRRELGLKEDDIVLGIAATLRSWKGHLYILRAMPEILRDFPGAKLTIVGEGQYRLAIEPEIKSLNLGGSVIMTGHREDIPEVVAAFDIAVMASYASEGIPQFALQAMAAGKPVIGTTVGGIPEVVIDGLTGIVIAPKDPSAIARAAGELLRDPGMMKRMGEAGRKAVLDNYTREMMLDKMETLYTGILK